MMEVFPVSIRPHAPGDVRNASGKPCPHDRIWYADWHAPAGRPKHRAQDIFAPLGSLVLAPVDGVVMHATTDPSPVGGHTISVKGGDGRIYYMAHLHRPPVVEAGQRVEAGRVLGLVGRTGSAERTCPHLHIGAWTGARATRRWVNLYPELRRLDPTVGGRIMCGPPKANQRTQGTQ